MRALRFTGRILVYAISRGWSGYDALASALGIVAVLYPESSSGLEAGLQELLASHGTLMVAVGLGALAVWRVVKASYMLYNELEERIALLSKPRPDQSFLDVLQYLRYNGYCMPEHTLEFFEERVVIRLSEEASYGNVTMWGRRQSNSYSPILPKMIEIPKDFWIKNRIETIAPTADRNMQVATMTECGVGSEKYFDLHFNKMQIEMVFPLKAISWHGWLSERIVPRVKDRSL